MESCAAAICTRDRPEELLRCLQAVSNQICRPAEIIVVDSASGNLRSKEIAEQFGCRFFFEERPGLSRARNRAIRESSSSLIAFLDDDAVPEPDWLLRLTDDFSSERIAAVSGRVLPLQVQTEAEILFDQAGGFVPNYGVRKSFDRKVANWFDLANFGGVGCGTNIAFRKPVLERIGGFDQRLGQGAPLLGYEDYDVIFKIMEQGFEILYTPIAVVKHPYPSTMQELKNRYLKGAMASGAYAALLFTERNGYRRIALGSIWKGITGKLRNWIPDKKSADIVSSPTLFVYRLRGICIYYQTLLSGRSRAEL